jgi:hypothetical protein
MALRARLAEIAKKAAEPPPVAKKSGPVVPAVSAGEPPTPDKLERLLVAACSEGAEESSVAFERLLPHIRPPLIVPAAFIAGLWGALGRLAEVSTAPARLVLVCKVTHAIARLVPPAYVFEAAGVWGLAVRGVRARLGQRSGGAETAAIARFHARDECLSSLSSLSLLLPSRDEGSASLAPSTPASNADRQYALHELSVALAREDEAFAAALPPGRLTQAAVDAREAARGRGTMARLAKGASIRAVVGAAQAAAVDGGRGAPPPAMPPPAMPPPAMPPPAMPPALPPPPPPPAPTRHRQPPLPTDSPVRLDRASAAAAAEDEAYAAAAAAHRAKGARLYAAARRAGEAAARVGRGAPLASNEGQLRRGGQRRASPEGAPSQAVPPTRVSARPPSPPRTGRRGGRGVGRTRPPPPRLSPPPPTREGGLAASPLAGNPRPSASQGLNLGIVGRRPRPPSAPRRPRPPPPPFRPGGVRSASSSGPPRPARRSSPPPAHRRGSEGGRSTSAARTATSGGRGVHMRHGGAGCACSLCTFRTHLVRDGLARLTVQERGEAEEALLAMMGEAEFEGGQAESLV